MATISKKQKLINEKVDLVKIHSFDEAVTLIKSLPAAKFVESLDVSINLGIDARKSDQMVRGSTVLPHGTGKKVRVAVFAQGNDAEAAKNAGAEFVGMDDLAEQIKSGMMDFDVVIAHPTAMGLVGRLGQVLGPRGLMPNPKVGTVSVDVATAVKNAKAGQVRYRTDKNGIIHCTIGKVNFAVEGLRANLVALLQDLQKAKPSTAKGVYLRRVTLSSTMGPGLKVDFASI